MRTLEGTKVQDVVGVVAWFCARLAPVQLSESMGYE